MQFVESGMVKLTGREKVDMADADMIVDWMI
jgi:hypothetical protein